MKPSYQAKFKMAAICFWYRRIHTINLFDIIIMQPIQNGRHEITEVIISSLIIDKRLFHQYKPLNRCRYQGMQ